MHANGRPPDPTPDPTAPSPAVLSPAGPRVVRRIVLFSLAFLLVPVGLIFLVFPYLLDEPFTSVDDLDPAKVRSLRVHLLNRTELDGGADVGPFHAAAADFAGLLAPVRAVPEVPDFPNARGPWLGEFRVLTTDGRRGRIRFYWVRDPHHPSDPPRLRFQIGGTKFEGGRVADVIAAAEAAEPRGTPVR